MTHLFRKSERASLSDQAGEQSVNHYFMPTANTHGVQLSGSP